MVNESSLSFLVVVAGWGSETNSKELSLEFCLVVCTRGGYARAVVRGFLIGGAASSRGVLVGLVGAWTKQ